MFRLVFAFGVASARPTSISDPVSASHGVQSFRFRAVVGRHWALELVVWGRQGFQRICGGGTTLCFPPEGLVFMVLLGIGFCQPCLGCLAMASAAVRQNASTKVVRFQDCDARSRVVWLNAIAGKAITSKCPPLLSRLSSRRTMICSRALPHCFLHVMFRSAARPECPH